MNAHSDKFHAPAEQISLTDLIAEYDAKVNGGEITKTLPDGTVEVLQTYAGVDAELTKFDTACSTLALSCSLGAGVQSEPFWGDGGRPKLDPEKVKASLLKSAWREIYRGMQIAKIAPKRDRERFDMMLADPPALTLDNIRDQFGDYLLDPRQHILRGLAEQFVNLDPAFKSHDKMKIGVKGLPKRIIMGGVLESYGGGMDRLRDVIAALQTYLERPVPEYQQFSQWHQVSKGLSPWRGQRYSQGAMVTYLEKAMVAKKYIQPGEWNPDEWAEWVNPLPGLELRVFKNGNGHLIFDKEMQREINLALAEYYGEVLADCPEARPEKQRKGTDVSKDLQFYPTPPKAVLTLIDRAINSGTLPYVSGHKRDEAPKEIKVLEPSCGEGAILIGLQDRIANPPKGYEYDKPPRVRAVGIEVHEGRAQTARAKGLSVVCKNFLEVAPDPTFDLILMNPPFYGKHYQQHVEHAKRFLRPGGHLLAILPITAVTDHEYVTGDRNGWMYDKWRDMPVGSFASSGTNINTGIYSYTAPSKN